MRSCEICAELASAPQDPAGRRANHSLQGAMSSTVEAAEAQVAVEIRLKREAAGVRPGCRVDEEWRTTSQYASAQGRASIVLCGVATEFQMGLEQFCVRRYARKSCVQCFIAFGQRGVLRRSGVPSRKESCGKIDAGEVRR